MTDSNSSHMKLTCPTSGAALGPGAILPLEVWDGKAAVGLWAEVSTDGVFETHARVGLLEQQLKNVQRLDVEGDVSTPKTHVNNGTQYLVQTRVWQPNNLTA